APACVPLRLPRSRTRTNAPAIDSSQWKRETVESSITRSLDGCEPIAQRSAGSAHVAPPTISTRKRRIARRRRAGLGTVDTGGSTAIATTISAPRQGVTAGRDRGVRDLVDPGVKRGRHERAVIVVHVDARAGERVREHETAIVDQD